MNVFWRWSDEHRQILLDEAAALMAYSGEPPPRQPLDFKARAFKLAAQRKQPVLSILP